MDEDQKLAAPHMSKAEVGLLEAIVVKSCRYMEFGIGGSTLLAVRAKVSTIVSVDSDPKWVAAVKAHVEVAPRIADDSISVLHADIGPVREWGNPLNREHVDKWPKYLSTAWSEWIRRQQFPDLVLVDGRFRVACCLSVVLASVSFGPLELPTLLIHDFNDERPQYREILEFFDITQQADSLCHLKLRKYPLNLEAMVRLFDRQYDLDESQSSTEHAKSHARFFT